MVGSGEQLDGDARVCGLPDAQAEVEFELGAAEAVAEDVRLEPIGAGLSDDHVGLHAQIFEQVRKKC